MRMLRLSALLLLLPLCFVYCCFLFSYCLFVFLLATLEETYGDRFFGLLSASFHVAAFLPRLGGA